MHMLSQQIELNSQFSCFQEKDDHDLFPKNEDGTVKIDEATDHISIWKVRLLFTSEKNSYKKISKMLKKKKS